MKRINQMETVLQRCCAKQQLSHNEIKNMFQTLSLCIMELQQQQTMQKRQIRQAFHEESAKLLVRKEARSLEESMESINLMIDKTVSRVSKLEEHSELQIELRKSVVCIEQKINQKFNQLSSTPRTRKQLAQIQKQRQRKQQQRREQERREQERREKQQQEIKQKQQAYHNQQELLKQIIIKTGRVNSWSQLSTKTRLDLSSCGLEKLPDQFANLTQLTALWLFRNRLSEVPNMIGNLINLQILSLCSNFLKEVPEQIGILAKLKQLDVSDNQLKELPGSMIALVNLKKLYIDENQLTVFPQWINKLEQLESLAIEDNQMILDITVLMGLKQLKFLSINEYQLESDWQVQQLKQHCGQREIRLEWSQND